ncbi:hypothetical protein ABH999_003605 [Bradyrhizobium yuanmingense]|uniref:HD domain-containing phosphohydrolase n=1 Tax=Bradyrhizobium yuanmingense TaxID=108015 RepID=UPI0004AE6D1D
MTDTTSIPPRLTPCKINPLNFCGRTRRRRRQNNSMPSSAVSTTSTRRVVASELSPSGYIPIAARVVAVADVFDALTTRRPYKEPMPLELARGYLVENAGRQFDPGCVEAFLLRWDEVVEIAGGQRTIPLPGTAAPLAPDIECAAASSSDARHPAEAVPTA